MLRVKLCVLTVVLVVTVLLFLPSVVNSETGVVRLTNTVEQAVSLNPSLSDDGRVVVFESSANLFTGGLNDSFHAMRAEVGGASPVFRDLGSTRIVAPSLSSDGSVVAFGSREDLTGENFDRNAEIFLLNSSGIRQLTHTSAQIQNSQPSMSADGRLIVFVANGDLLLFDVDTDRVTVLAAAEGATSPKLSGDGLRVYYQRGSDLVSIILQTKFQQTVVKDIPKLSLGVGRAVSHDGMRLVYAAEPVENQSQVFLFDARDETNRQITQLGSRVTDVSLQPAISSDGKRVAFATRRRVVNASDGSVELYLSDIPSGQTQQITNAPSSATAEVVAALNFDGSVIAFSFARVLSGMVAEDFQNNSEIYLASVAPRPQFGTAMVLNAAALGKEPGDAGVIAPGSIAVIRGSSLAFKTQSTLSVDPPLALGGTTVHVNGRSAPIFYVSPEEVVFVVPDGLADGPAEVVATNADGFPSKAKVVIAAAAPGIFTVAGNGEGEAIVLDADFQTVAPFDPSNAKLRVSIFATGLAHAQTVSVVLNGQTLSVDTITSSGLRGLDEIHVRVPAELRGAGNSTLSVTADGVQSNPVTVVIGGSALRDLVINEFLADPPDGLAGDANRDGVRDTADDEFVELVNSTTRDIDLGGYQLLTRSLTAAGDTVRHRFAPGTILPAGGALVVFGGGAPNASDPTFGGAQVVKASSGGLGLTNSGGVISVRDTEGGIVVSVSYGTVLGLRADQNQSLTRSPDIIGPLALHLSSSAHPFSPGTKLDGSVFIRVPPPPPPPTPTPTPSPTPTPTPTPNAKSQIVISQIFGGGGNANAPYRNDFIELFNSGATTIDLTGWSVQYAGATSATWSVTPLTSTTLAPGQYYLVQQAAGANNGSALPQPDATGTIAMAAAAGKVALVKTTNALTGSCPNDSNIIDLVGYGATANCFKGSAPTSAPSNTNAISRKSDGCTDTLNNSADFITTQPNPRNLASPVNICAQSAAGFDDSRFIYAHAHRSHLFPSRTLRLRQLPRRPT